jgi:hypothetical protein
MRTTLDIDGDVLHAVKERARRESKTMGEVMSGLARNALLTRAPQVREPEAFYGIRPFGKRGGIVTNELIDKLRDDDIY